LATAAPHRPDSNIIHRRTPAPIPASPTRDAPAPACTNGLPASKQHHAGYPINNYTVVTPDDNNWTSYAVDEDWYGHHFVSGPHVSSSSPVSCRRVCCANVGCMTDHELQPQERSLWPVQVPVYVQCQGQLQRLFCLVR
jgi:hypothetical protein